MRLVVLFISLLVIQSSQMIGQIDLRLKADTNHIRIGEKIGIQLIVIDNQQENTEISWPFAMDTLSKSIEIIELMAVDTQSFDEETVFLQQWYVTSFDTGYQEVPPFEVIINGEARTTDPFLIQVETVKIDTSQAIKVIKGVEDVPISILDFIKYHWKWFAAGVVLVILIVGVYLIIKNKNKELVLKDIPAKPIIPPFELALQRLEKLNEGKWWQQGDIKYYHSEISEILREYLEHEFDFPALEQTTREVMRSIRLTSIGQAQQKHLNRILALSDLVKYAKEKPLADENKDMMKLALDFVNKTKPKEEVKKEKENLENEA